MNYCKNYCFLFAFLLSIGGFAQNLVPNPSYEDLAFPGIYPSGHGQWSLTDEWTNINPSDPDYFHVNATSTSVDVPDNDFGNENAHDGDAYIGIATSDTDWEYASVELSSPMTAGNTYRVRFYVSLADERTSPFRYELMQLGALFTSTQPSRSGTGPILQSPQVVSDGSRLDEDNGWMLIEDYFTVPSGSADLDHLIIGNFQDVTELRNNVYPAWNLSLPLQTYYYIDDVAVEDVTSLPACDCANNDYTVEVVSETPDPDGGCCYQLKATKKSGSSCPLYGISVMDNGTVIESVWSGDALLVNASDEYLLPEICIASEDVPNDVSFGFFSSDNSSNFPGSPDCTASSDIECDDCACSYWVGFVPVLSPTDDCCVQLRIAKNSSGSCDLWGMKIDNGGNNLFTTMNTAGTSPMLDIITDTLTTGVFCISNTDPDLQLTYFDESIDPNNPVEMCNATIEIPCVGNPGTYCDFQPWTPTFSATHLDVCKIEFVNTTANAPAGWSLYGHKWTTSEGQEQLNGTFIVNTPSYVVPIVDGVPRPELGYYPSVQICLTVILRNNTTGEFCYVQVCGNYQCDPSFGIESGKTGEMAGQISETWTVFPNPADAGGMLRIGLDATLDYNARIELYDLQGRIVTSKTMRIVKGENSFTLNLPESAHGSYILRLTDDVGAPRQMMIQID